MMIRIAMVVLLCASTLAARPLRITSDITVPKVIRQVDPVFPEALRKKQRRNGIIILESVITKEGKVTAVRVLQGGSDPLSKYAIDAFKQWRFEPATHKGKPVDVFYNVLVNINVR